MSVLKPRIRLINFRLTDEEFVQLRDACRDQGARSISDFARSAVMAQAGEQSNDSPSRIETLLQGMDARLQQMSEQLDRLSGVETPS